jgi:hypothetical protein
MSFYCVFCVKLITLKCLALILLRIEWSHFQLCPVREIELEKDLIVMKILKNLLFILVLITGFSLSSFAQKNDDKKPPKGDGPKVSPTEKNPPKNPPPSNDDKGDKPKKPQTGLAGEMSKIIL